MTKHWAQAKLEDVEVQMRALDLKPVGSNWRDRERKRRVMQLLRDEAAKYRRLLKEPDQDDDSPF